MQRISLTSLYEQARIMKIPRRSKMSKGELHKALGIIRVEHLPKYSLENTENGETTKWKSVNLISTTLKTNPGNVFYALKKERALTVGGVKYVVRKI